MRAYCRNINNGEAKHALNVMHRQCIYNVFKIKEVIEKRRDEKRRKFTILWETNNSKPLRSYREVTECWVI
jgi:hypothetical protein